MALKPANILLEKHLHELGLEFLREHRFHETRLWRFDYALTDSHIALEIEGGLYSNGRHVRGKGFQGDLDKYNHATMLGWRVLRFSTQDVLRGRARAFLKEHLNVSQS